jgi:hypothetical protein
LNQISVLMDTVTILKFSRSSRLRVKFLVDRVQGTICGHSWATSSRWKEKLVTVKLTRDRLGDSADNSGNATHAVRVDTLLETARITIEAVVSLQPYLASNKQNLQ